MMNLKLWEARAVACGFSHTGPLNPSVIQLHPEVREACAADRCRSYDKNWVCPPACGTLEQCAAQLRRYSTGLLVQTTGPLEDSMDYEAMMELAAQHGASFDKFADEVRAEYPGALVLGDGACRRCKTCTYPDAPCRFPERRSSAMEAFGMVVSEVCARSDLPYYYGPGTLTYIGCVLFE